MAHHPHIHGNTITELAVSAGLFLVAKFGYLLAIPLNIITDVDAMVFIPILHVIQIFAGIGTVGAFIVALLNFIDNRKKKNTP